MIQNQYQLTNFQLGFITTIYSLLSLIGLIFWSFYIETKKNYSLIKLGTFIWIVFLIYLIFFSGDYTSFLISIAIVGFFIESTNIFVYRVLIIEKEIHNAGLKYSLISMLQGAGGVFGALLTAQLQEFFDLDWKFTFLFIAVILFLCLIFVLVKIRTLPEIFFGIHPNSDNSTKLFEESTGINKSIIKVLLFSFISISFISSWIQKYFQDIHGLSQAGSVIIVIIFAFAQLLAFIIGGIIVDRLYLKRQSFFPYFGPFFIFLTTPFLIIGFSMRWIIQMENSPSDYFSLGLQLIQIVLSDFYIFLAIFFIFFGYFYNFFVPYLYIIIRVCNTEKNAYRMINLIFIIISFSLFVCPAIGGFISDIFNLRFLMILASLMLFISGFFYGKIIRISRIKLK